jgi:hypothetical protein
MFNCATAQTDIIMRFKILLLVAMVIGAVSCKSVDVPMDVTVGGEVLTTVNVDIPEVSRATSGGGFDLSTLGSQSGYEMRFILEIYYQDKCASRQVKYVSEPSTAFDVRLAPERDYRFVVWADIVAKVDNRDMSADYDHYYETSSSLTNVQIVDTLWRCNALERDAYTGYADVVNFSSASSINVSLVRPFAMLNVVTTDDASQVAKLDVVYEGVPTTFNAYEGEVGESQAKSHQQFDVAGGPAVGGEKTLFTDYIFAPTKNTSLKFTMSAYDSIPVLIKENNFQSGITIKRNTLTTVKGRLLSGN